MCTGMRFNDTEGRMFFGRNLDWTFDYGERALVVPRGFKPASPFGATSEISHALIGMGVVEEGQPLLFDAGNDAGLAVAGLNFPGYAEYAPAPIEGKTNVAAWEFPLWVAANFATVDEVAAALQDAVIVDDLATAQLVRSIAPGLRLHGSTQMSIHTAEGAKMLAKLGYSRAILARELSLAEIEAAEAGMPGLAELERIAAETVEKIPIRIGDDPEF